MSYILVQTALRTSCITLTQFQAKFKGTNGSKVQYLLISFIFVAIKATEQTSGNLNICICILKKCFLHFGFQKAILNLHLRLTKGQIINFCLFIHFVHMNRVEDTLLLHNHVYVRGTSMKYIQLRTFFNIRILSQYLRLPMDQILKLSFPVSCCQIWCFDTQNTLTKTTLQYS